MDKREGSAPCHLSLSSFWHGTGFAFALGTQWESLPFHSEAESYPGTAKHFLFLLTATAVSQLPQHVPEPVVPLTHSSLLRPVNSLGLKE